MLLESIFVYFGIWIYVKNSSFYSLSIYKIEVMKSGTVEEMGSYKELMAKKGLLYEACHRERLISLSDEN